MSKKDKWIIGAILVAISTVFNVFTASQINNYYNKQTSVYRLALKTTNKDKFNYIVDSQQGNVITYGKLTATNPVRFQEMKPSKKFLAVKRTLEEYTMHTETTTDSKGHTTTTIYWSWDDEKTDYKYAKQVELFGRKYDLSKFNVNGYFNYVDADKITNCNNGYSGHYYYLDGDTRYEYKVIPITISGSFIAQATGGTLKPIKNKSYIILSQEKYKNYLKERQNNNRFVAAFVVVMLSVIELGSIYIFIFDEEN